MPIFDLSKHETLVNQSRVWLFGRLMADISINLDVYDTLLTNTDGEVVEQPPHLGDNRFLLRQFSRRKDPKLARIYAYSYESIFYDLSRPTILLVHGEGIDADTPSLAFEDALSLLDRAPPNVGRTGLGTQSGSFASTMRAWAYDRADFSMRLDAESGSIESLLSPSEPDMPDGAGQSAGSLARSAGSLARSAGSLARSAGSLARSGRGNRNRE